VTTVTTRDRTQAPPPTYQSPAAETLTRLRAFIQENFLYLRPEGFTLADDDRLLERGVIDSMGVVELLAFVEAEFGVTADEDEITETNFGSIQAIASFIASKRETH
jgi:acyl carrier protein